MKPNREYQCQRTGSELGENYVNGLNVADFVLNCGEVELVDLFFYLSVDHIEDVGSSQELLLQKCTQVLTE